VKPVWGLPKWMERQGVTLTAPAPATPTKKFIPMKKPEAPTPFKKRIVLLGGRYYPQYNKGSHWELFFWPGTCDPVWFEQNGEAIHFAQNNELVTWSE